jgi:hypothetical protein
MARCLEWMTICTHEGRVCSTATRMEGSYEMGMTICVNCGQEWKVATRRLGGFPQTRHHDGVAVEPKRRRVMGDST